MKQPNINPQNEKKQKVKINNISTMSQKKDKWDPMVHDGFGSDDLIASELMNKSTQVLAITIMW